MLSTLKKLYFNNRIFGLNMEFYFHFSVSPTLKWSEWHRKEGETSAREETRRNGRGAEGM